MNAFAFVHYKDFFALSSASAHWHKDVWLAVNNKQLLDIVMWQGLMIVLWIVSLYNVNGSKKCVTY